MAQIHLKNSCSFTVNTIVLDAVKFSHELGILFPKLNQEMPGEGLRGEKCKADH